MGVSEGGSAYGPLGVLGLVLGVLWHLVKRYGALLIFVAMYWDVACAACRGIRTCGTPAICIMLSCVWALLHWGHILRRVRASWIQKAAW